MQTYQGELGYKEGLFSKNDDILKYIPFSLFSNLLLLITETYSFDIKNFEVVEKLNNTLKNIVDKSPNNIRDYGFIVEDLTEIILIAIKGTSMKNKEQLLEWCKILYKKFKKGLFPNFNAFIKEYIQSLPDNKNNIFLEMVDFLCNIEMDKELTIIIIKNLTEKLMNIPELMNNESMVILIIEKLSKNSSLNLVYEAFSEVLGDSKNYTIISKMVNYLNQYLISDPNGFNFRKSLINKEDEKNNELFLKLYKILSFNPISLIVFCVITEHFELTYNIILNIIKIQLDNEYYIHLGQLVQLLESDLYDYIRIRLLEPTKNVYLIKALYGILMLLPQGQAFNVLSNRMCNVQALFEIENGFDNIKEEEEVNKEEINQLIEIFLNNQKLKREAEEKNIKHA
jgi:vacuole morphology and inheritance protein 14